MTWSWKLVTIAGIPVFMHWTFLILIAYVLWASYQPNQDLWEALAGAGYVLALFACVVMHEFGHAMAARRYGIATSDITLLPIGGVARLKRMPEEPFQELVVALAGPAVNLAIVLILLVSGVAVTIAPAGPDMAARAIIQNNFWASMLITNIILLLFNLLPAFPMDGGRVLRALLAMKMEYARATRSAASVGKMMAIVFGFWGLTGGAPMLLLVAIFVWISAESEASGVEQRTMLRDVGVKDAMLTEFQHLSPKNTLAEAAEALLAGSQHDFPVVGVGPTGERTIVGVLSRSQLIQGLAQFGRNAAVETVMLPPPPKVDVRDALLPAMNNLREKEIPFLQVVADNQTVGLINLENIGELLMIRAALEHAGRQQHPQ